MTRTKPAEQRRAELLAAGQALFLAKGIAGTSLDDITQRAGVSKGLFYLYFASKEDLVLALREQFSRDLAERMRAAAEAVPASTLPASGGTGWADRLDACVRAGLERYRDLHDLHEVLFHHAHASSPASGSVTPGTVTPDSGNSGSPDPAPAPAARVIRELLEAGVAAGAFDLPDPESTAVLCYASMHAFDHDFRGRPGPDDARLIRAAQQLFRRAAGLP
ncbi:MAG TPA: TetR/AcrR family transcriptional regulator [Streptosporangiaceae bacterium]|nr:TetR/AcrR family transcriptional regulator [Streptosporangiaceae bacterium]